VLQTVPAGQQLPVLVQAGGTSHAGGRAMHVLLEEQILFGSPQSASATHCTQALPPGLSLQIGVGGAQSVPCVAAVQTGTQVSCALHFCPGAVHCGVVRHCTHADGVPPLATRQCGVLGVPLQSESVVHVGFAWQVFCAVHTLPAPQSLSCVHCTQTLVPPVTTLQCGSVGSARAQSVSSRHGPVYGWQV
jgi:hypothetical protein